MKVGLITGIIVILTGGIEGVRDLAEENRNKEIVMTFYNRLFGLRDLSAITEFIAPGLIQHNPLIADGQVAMFNSFRALIPPGSPPNKRLFIQRVAAEEDLVWIHALNNPTLNGTPSADKAYLDIYRVQGGLIVEHFDVIQPLPTTSKNPHPIFEFTRKEYNQECNFVRI